MNAGKGPGVATQVDRDSTYTSKFITLIQAVISVVTIPKIFL